VITAFVIDQQLGGDRRTASPAVVAEPEDGGLAQSVEHHLARYFAAFDGELPPDGLHDRVLAEVERPLLTLTLAACRGNQIRAARLLGINRNTLRKKLLEYGIDASTVRRSA
jgi:two-component system nitrogen regulation response regulator GlnG